MSDRRHTDEDRRLRGEGELTADLITAAKEAESPLSQHDIDRILGVDPNGD